MQEMNLYNNLPKSPLTAGARFIRGFRRIGMAFAVLTLTIGFVTVAWIAIVQRNDAQRRYDQAMCIVTMYAQKQNLVMNTYRKDEIDMGASGCYGPGYTATFNTVWGIAQTKPAYFEGAFEPVVIGTPIASALAAIVYFLFWGIGWLCAGFTRD